MLWWQWTSTSFLSLGLDLVLWGISQGLLDFEATVPAYTLREHLWILLCIKNKFNNFLRTPFFLALNLILQSWDAWLKHSFQLLCFNVLSMVWEAHTICGCNVELVFPAYPPTKQSCILVCVKLILTNFYVPLSWFLWFGFWFWASETRSPHISLQLLDTNIFFVA